MTGASSSFDDAHHLHRRVDLSRPSDQRALVATVIAALLALLIWSPSIGGRPPGDPAAIAGDARLGRCGATVADVEFAFTIPRARDYQRYLPAMERTSELEIEPPALVVVFRAGVLEARASAGASAVASSPADAASGSISRKVCIYVGKAGQGELNFYSDVSIAGLRATPDGPLLVPARQT